jgi:hypothetical protein
MTWNAEGILSNGRELALLNLLNDNDFNVGIVTETEIPSSGHGDYNVEGYHSYLPLSPLELLKTGHGIAAFIAGNSGQNPARSNAYGSAVFLDPARFRCQYVCLFLTAAN